MISSNAIPECFNIRKQGQYWTPEGIKLLYNEGGKNWVFIARSMDVIAKISEKVKLVIGFSRGERYPLVEETEDSFVIKIKNDKIPVLGESGSYDVNLPRNIGKLVNLTKPLTPEESAIFKLSVVDGISGIKKPCNTETAIAKKYGGSASAAAGLSLDKFWIFLTAKGEIHASTETSKLEQFPKDSNISREYYTRDTRSGVYKLTRNKACSGNQGIKFVYTNPDIEEITISEEWANNSNLATDKRTKQIFISCPQQYFKYFDELIEWNFEPSEIPFVISKTAKFKSLSTPGCTSPE